MCASDVMLVTIKKRFFKKPKKNPIYTRKMSHATNLFTLHIGYKRNIE